MQILNIKWVPGERVAGEIQLTDGQTVQCEFYWRCDDFRGGVEPDVASMDLSGVEGVRIIVRANLGFVDAAYELTDDGERLWGDGIRITELRTTDDGGATGVLLTGDGIRTPFEFQIPQRFGEQVPGLPAEVGALVADPQRRATIENAVTAFQIAAGPHPR